MTTKDFQLICDQLGPSSEAIAALIGRSPAYVAKVRRGNTPVSLKLALRFIALGIFVARGPHGRFVSAPAIRRTIQGSPRLG